MPNRTAIEEALEVVATDREEGARRRHAQNVKELFGRMDRFGKRRSDPVRMVQSLIGDRWSPMIIHLLSGGMLRFVELRRLIALGSAEGTISSRMLTLKLRLLERDGWVARHVTDDQPPRVEYQLTALGAGGYEYFNAFVQWVEQASPLVHVARRDYDAKHPDSVALLRDAQADDLG
jgi:DNA-binding HxlR family transcriptional regulator